MKGRRPREDENPGKNGCPFCNEAKEMHNFGRRITAGKVNPAIESVTQAVLRHPGSTMSMDRAQIAGYTGTKIAATIQKAQTFLNQAQISVMRW